MAADAATRLVKLCAQKKLHIGLAESCTGGLASGAITDVPGASEVFDCGIVAYANRIKIELLDVPQALIAVHGAVSAQVAAAMATGAVKRSKADAAVSITGIAGPGGGTPEKPVGLVYIATATRKGAEKATEHHFAGNRASVRQAAVEAALEMLYETVQGL